MRDTIYFSVSSYQGFEQDVLAVRNRNRTEHQTKSYVDWRYLGQKSSTSPLIFWVHMENGIRIGMAALIFRPYWVDGELQEFAVLGDISLDNKLRGTGIAKRWFGFINDYIEREKVVWTLVIPNVIASKVLSATGWETNGFLIHHVYLLKPLDKIKSYIKFQLLSSTLSNFFNLVMNYKLSMVKINNFTMHEVDEFDDSFDVLWRSFDKDGLIVRDRSLSSLVWRYSDRPASNFVISKFFHHGRFCGYIVSDISSTDRTCIIYEILVAERRLLKNIMSLFIKSKRENPDLLSLRLILNENHQYSASLSEIGFFRRKEENLFQTYPLAANRDDMHSGRWFLSSGDKDT